MAYIQIRIFVKDRCRRTVNDQILSSLTFWFLHVCCITLLKTLWEKGKLLVSRNFSICRGLRVFFFFFSAKYKLRKSVHCYIIFYTPFKDRTYYGITCGVLSKTGRTMGSPVVSCRRRDILWDRPWCRVEDGTYYGITRGVLSGRWRPVLCPEHIISKAILAMVMKFCGWIDLIKGSALHMNLNLACLIFELFLS